MACRAKENDKVLRRGEPSIEWYKDGKPQYYCYGYIEKMSDELLPECKECRSHVRKAQDDLDEYNRRMKIMNEVKDYPPYLDYPNPHKPKTNADRIRAMSDEELAEEISRISILDLCDIVCGGDCKAVATFNKTSQQRCAEIVLDWLQDAYKKFENKRIKA